MSTLTPRQARENQRFPYDALLYHEHVGSIITAIPKSGCSSIKRWFIAAADPAALDTPTIDVHKHAAAHFALSRLPRTEADLLLRTRPVIAVVRDPLHRLRAAFIDKFVRPAAGELMPAAQEVIAFAQSINHGSDHRVTFREFVTLVCSADVDHLDAHWRPQAAFLQSVHSTRLVPLDRLTATLGEYAAAIGRTIDLPPQSVTRKEPVGTGCLADIPAGELHARNLRPPLEELADAALRSMVESRLRADVALYQQALRS